MRAYGVPMASVARGRMLIGAGLALLLAVAVAGPAMARGGGEAASVEVRVWQNVDDERDLYVSARPAGGSWRTLGTVPLPLDGLTPSESYRYGDIALALPQADGEVEAEVEVRVWQNVDVEWRFFIAARPADGSWLETLPLLPDDGLSTSGRYRYGDITLALRPQVTTLAGRAGKHGYADGLADEALFGEAWGVGIPGRSRGLGLAIDGEGSVIVADAGNHAIRRIAPDGTVTTIAGGNEWGLRDGPATTAQFAGPMDVAIAADGSIYVADTYNHRIRRIADGVVSTVAGNGPIFYWPSLDPDDQSGGGYLDGPARRALFSFPQKIAFAPDGGLFITEARQHIRHLSSIGWVSTFAGGDLYPQQDGPLDSIYVVDAIFGTLRAIDTDAEGNVYVIDSHIGIAPGAVAIRKIDTQGVVSTIFSGAPAGAGGVLSFPSGLVVADDGAIYIANTGRHQILELRDGELRGVAGTGTEGHTDGDRDEAAFSLPGAIAIAGDGAFVVADEGSGIIRRIAPVTDERDTRVPAVARAKWLPATVERFTGREASFDSASGMALDAAGNVIVADFGNHAIRRVAPDGMVTTIAGSNGEGVLDGPATTAQFAGPKDVAIHTDGSIYVADSLGNRIRRIAPDGTVTTVAGGGPITRFGGERGDFRDGPATLARFREPRAIAFDHDGNLLIADGWNNLIRKLSPTGHVSSFVGAGDPRSVAVDDDNNVFFAHNLTTVSKVANGTITQLLQVPHAQWGGELLHIIEGLAVSPDDDIYLADPHYDLIVKVSGDGSFAFVAVDAEPTPFGFTALLFLDDGTLLASGNDAIWRITFDAE